MDYDRESTMHGEKMKGFNDLDKHSEFVDPGPYRLGYKYWATYNFHTSFSKNCYYYEDEAKKKFFEPYETDGEVSVAIDFMEKHKDSNKPFMLMIAPHPPHNPWKEWRAVKTKQYTYVKWIDGKEELYDDMKDPYQMKNLVDNDNHREKLRELREEIKKLLIKANDEFLPGTAYRKWFNNKRQVIYHE